MTYAIRTTVATAALVAAALMSAHSYAADTWPSKTIRVLAAGAAGGPIDIMSRVVMAKLSEQLG